MLETIKEQTTSFLFKVIIKSPEEEELKVKEEPLDEVSYNTEEEEDGNQPRTSDKIGRNDPCPCGSGKKYKNCCGRM